MHYQFFVVGEPNPADFGGALFVGESEFSVESLAVTFTGTAEVTVDNNHGSPAATFTGTSEFFSGTPQPSIGVTFTGSSEAEVDEEQSIDVWMIGTATFEAALLSGSPEPIVGDGSMEVTENLVAEPEPMVGSSSVEEQFSSGLVADFVGDSTVTSEFFMPSILAPSPFVGTSEFNLTGVWTNTATLSVGIIYGDAVMIADNTAGIAYSRRPRRKDSLWLWTGH